MSDRGPAAWLAIVLLGVAAGIIVGVSFLIAAL